MFTQNVLLRLKVVLFQLIVTYDIHTKVLIYFAFFHSEVGDEKFDISRFVPLCTLPLRTQIGSCY